jgi:hypothetical protein
MNLSDRLSDGIFRKTTVHALGAETQSVFPRMRLERLDEVYSGTVFVFSFWSFNDADSIEAI